MGYGAASELGPLLVNSNGTGVEFNKFAWNKGLFLSLLSATLNGVVFIFWSHHRVIRLLLIKLKPPGAPPHAPMYVELLISWVVTLTKLAQRSILERAVALSY